MAIRSLRHAKGQEIDTVSPDGETPKTYGTSFFRGETRNFNPYGSDNLVDDFAQRFVLKGWLPSERFISPQTQITAFGACFARNISEHLAKLGFSLSKDRAKDIFISSMGEGLVNVHSIVQQFRWALEGWTPPTNLWHDYKADEQRVSEGARKRTREVFLKTEVFVLTFGLSEIWYDEVTGGVFWRAVPMESYDSTRHKFRVCTFAETKACIVEILTLIERHVPSAKVVLTLSPIPLIATFRPVSCISANSASKALLRAALDEVLRELSDFGSRVFYFPAFELVNELFPNRFKNDGRHPYEMVITSIMQLFEAAYCVSPMSMEEAGSGLKKARLAGARTLLDHPLFGKAFEQD